jgi:hypothetical protein
MLRRFALAALVGTVLVIVGSGTASGSGCAQGATPTLSAGLGAICIPAHDRGHGGTESEAGSPPAQVRNVGPTGCSSTSGRPVPCSTSLGAWSAANQCYSAPYNAPAGSAAWQGHTDGSLSLCSTCAKASRANTCTGQVLWLAPGTAPAVPDPAQMARQALGLLQLPSAQVHTAPKAPAHTYVGVENWLWVPKGQWAGLTKTVTAGATRVTVSATPDRIVWDMGPASKTCYGPGREWLKGMTEAARTDCGFTYAHTSDEEPGQRFALAAVIQFEVNWVCSGACTANAGTLGLVPAPAGTGALTVRQRQTVVVR